MMTPLPLRKELEMMDNTPQTHLFMGIAGHDNTGKTAIVTDAFSKWLSCPRTEQESNTNCGVLTLRVVLPQQSAFHRDNDNIKTFEPWVMMKGDSTAYNYPATHDRVMSLHSSPLIQKTEAT